MCFSAEVDFAAGAVITAIGVDALRHVRRVVDVPITSLPLVFGTHQLIEGFVWLGLDGRVSAQIERVAVWAYLVIALILLPVYAPAAVYLTERNSSRRRYALGWFVALGIVVAAFMVAAMVNGPVGAAIEGHHVDYSIKLANGDVLVGLYVVATCGALLASTSPRLRLLGAANLVAVAALAWIESSALVSLWCLWAALLSGALAVHIRLEHRQTTNPGIPAAIA